MQYISGNSGTLLSGKEFDSSYKRGQPASFGVG
jgi:FKBP-type peptidyl-prolyl cis-trans isomerase